MALPDQHRTKLHSTNPIERLNKEVKRRADVVGIFPNKASIMRLIGTVLFEQNEEWQTSGHLITTSSDLGNYTTLTDATNLFAQSKMMIPQHTPLQVAVIVVSIVANTHDFNTGAPFTSLSRGLTRSKPQPN